MKEVPERSHRSANRTEQLRILGGEAQNLSGALDNGNFQLSFRDQ
jgi:hypothetical protein